MNFTELSTKELLSKLVGESVADELYKNRLKPLMLGETDAAPHPLLAVAWELSKRMLKEGVLRGPALMSSRIATDFLVAHFLGEEQGSFVVLLLDNHHRVIHIEELYRGTIDGTLFYARDVVKVALKHNAAAVVFAHNHPSGVPEPSSIDVTLTTRLRDALALVDVRTLDHIVVGGERTVSFADRRLI